MWCKRWSWKFSKVRFKCDGVVCGPNQLTTNKARITLLQPIHKSDYNLLGYFSQISKSKSNPIVMQDKNAPPQGHDCPSHKIAPRSTSQFKIGPAFSGTTIHNSILDVRGKEVKPKISARIDRGFNFTEGAWIGYKRNYFTLVACFKLQNYPLSVCNNTRFMVEEKGTAKPLHAFKLLLKHTCRHPDLFRSTLVQHTAKRDRGPQSEPPEYMVVPGELPDHDIMRELANIRCDARVGFYDQLFYMQESDREKAVTNPLGMIYTYPGNSRIATVARYERVQFQTTAIGPRRGISGELSFLEVHLTGITGDAHEVLLASASTGPLIVRGRSPLSYTRSKVKVLIMHEKAQDEEVKQSLSKMVTLKIPKRKQPYSVKVLGRNTNLENRANKSPNKGKKRLNGTNSGGRPVVSAKTRPVVKPLASSAVVLAALHKKDSSLETEATVTVEESPSIDLNNKTDTKDGISLDSFGFPKVTEEQTRRSIKQITKLPPIDGFNFNETINMLQPAMLSREAVNPHFDPVVGNIEQYNSDDERVAAANGIKRTLTPDPLRFYSKKRPKPDVQQQGWRFMPPLNVPILPSVPIIPAPANYHLAYSDGCRPRYETTPRPMLSGNRWQNLSAILIGNSLGLEAGASRSHMLLFGNSSGSGPLNLPPHKVKDSSYNSSTPSVGFFSGYPALAPLHPYPAFPSIPVIKPHTQNPVMQPRNPFCVAPPVNHEHQVFLQTSTPSPMMPGTKPPWALTGNTTDLCKHGLKIPTYSLKKLMGPVDLFLDEYDSSFQKLRETLDNIKKSIKIEPPLEQLSPLSSLRSSLNRTGHLLWDELLNSK